MERFEQILRGYGLGRKKVAHGGYKYIKAGANKLIAKKRKNQLTTEEWNEGVEKIYYAIFSMDENPLVVESPEKFLGAKSVLNKLPEAVVEMINLGLKRTSSDRKISANMRGSYKIALGRSLRTEKGRVFGEEIIANLGEEEKIKTLFNEEIKKTYIELETLELLKRARAEIEKKENTQELKERIIAEINNWLQKQLES